MNKPIWELKDPQPWCICKLKVGRQEFYQTSAPSYWCRKCANWFVQSVPYGELRNEQ